MPAKPDYRKAKSGDAKDEKKSAHDRIKDLEDELAKANEQKPKAEPTKDQFGRPAVDGSAW